MNCVFQNATTAKKEQTLVLVKDCLCLLRFSLNTVTHCLAFKKRKQWQCLKTCFSSEPNSNYSQEQHVCITMVKFTSMCSCITFYDNIAF